MFVSKAAVIGAGDLGEQLVQAIAGAGYAAVHIEVDPAVGAPDYGALGDVDLVIDVVPADMELKQAIFADLDAATPGHAILASDTALSVSEIAEAVLRPDKVVGFHLVGKRLVEVIEGDETSPDTVQITANFAQSIRKQPIKCVESPGVVIDRVVEAIDGLEGEQAPLMTFVEACMVLEEGVATVRDIDVGLMAGAGVKPGPFLAADQRGLDELLEALDQAAEQWGDDYAPPLMLQRLVAQGRLGVKAGQGFYPYVQPDEGWSEGPVKLQTVGSTAVVWLDNPPANSLSPDTLAGIQRAWEQIDPDPAIHAMVLASSNPALFCAGADIKAFTQMDEAACQAMLDRVHALLQAWERSRTVTIAAVNGLAFGGGCEIAMACDVRLASYSATFGQPEINLGIIPGFGGTQRLPRLVGHAKAIEMNLAGEAIGAEDAYEHGLVSRVLPDHELFDTALMWARKLGSQAPVARGFVKSAMHAGDSADGVQSEKDGFLGAFLSDDGKEGVEAFLAKRQPTWTGK